MVKSLRQIYKESKNKRGYKGSQDDFKSDFGNSEEYFFDSIGDWRKWRNKKGYESGGLIKGKPKLAKKGWN